jgi:hypothetical protein
MNTHTTNSDLEIPNIDGPPTSVTKLFTHTNLKIAYRTNNSIEQDLKPKASGVCILTCSDCRKVYVGQAEISKKFTENIIEPQRITANPLNSPKTEITAYIPLGLWRISCKCHTFRRKKKMCSSP